MAQYVAGSWQTPVVIMNGNPSNVYEMVELAGDGFGNYLAVIDQSTSGLSAMRDVNGAWRPAEPIGAGQEAYICRRPASPVPMA